MYDSYDGYTIDFGSKSLNFFELSPYYFSTFQVGGKKYRTLIHYWYATYFKDDEGIAEMIRNLDTPNKVILVGNRCGLGSLKQLDSKELLYGIQARLTQNKKVKDALMCTGNAYLNYIGSKGYLGYLSEDNRYGKLLMKVRDIYSMGKV